jgi:CheY-like chemotaxis protein/DNA-binding XRE family transcriptional regulator
MADRNPLGTSIVTYSLLCPLLRYSVKVPKDHKVPKTTARATSELQANLGKTIKAQRLRLGVTQEELAWRADLHRTYIADIERGGRNLTLRSIISLAGALQVSVASLLAQPGEIQHGSAVGEIMLIEDNTVDADLTLRAFKRAKFSNPVTVIRDGKAALEYLFGSTRPVARPRPLLILLDLNLPKVSGIEVLRRIKAHDQTRHIPVVVLTVSKDDKSILECAKLGAEQYIIKPVEFEKFSQVSPRLDLHWTLSSPLHPLNRGKSGVPQPASPRKSHT